MAVTRASITLNEFLELPETKPALEYANGEVSQKPSPGGQHSALQSFLSMWVNLACRIERTACAFPELRRTFNGRSYVPDVAVYRWERIPTDADGNVANDFLESPDVAIEIVSPSQSVTSLTRKCIWYVNNGVRVRCLSIRPTAPSSRFVPTHCLSPC